MNSPLPTFRSWSRAILKAVVFFVLFDSCFIISQPFSLLQRLSSYGVLVPYRTRIMRADTSISDQLVPLETMLAAHEIAVPKAADEYRVIVLGNSGINGYGNADDQTITAHMNQANVKLNGKRVHAYNLAFPQPYLFKDVVIAEAALAYSPDLLIFMLAPNDLRDVPILGWQISGLIHFFEINHERAARLSQEFGIQDRITEDTTKATGWWSRSILVARGQIYDWLKFQAYGLDEAKALVLPAGELLSEVLPTNPINAPFFANMTRSSPWMLLTNIRKLTNLPILIVNEPVFISPQAASQDAVNYNSAYSKVGYQSYRKNLRQLCTDQGFWCLDVWNLVPANHYTNSALHRDGEGQKITAQALLKALTQQKLR